MKTSVAGAIFCLVISAPVFSRATNPAEAPEPFFALLRTGREQFERGDYAQASDTFRRALASSRAARDAVSEAVCLKHLGLLTWNLGQVAAADDIFQQGLKVTGMIAGARDSLPFFQASLRIVESYRRAKSFRSQGRFGASVAAFGEALAEADRIRAPDFRVKCLRQLASTYFEMNDLNRFYDTNQEALALARALHNGREEANCLNNLGIWQLQTGQLMNAIKTLNSGLQIMSNYPANVGLSDLLFNFAQVNSLFSFYDKALNILEKVTFFDESNAPLQLASNSFFKALLLYKRGIATKNNGDLTNSHDLFEFALHEFKKRGQFRGHISSLCNLGLVHFELGEINEALKDNQEALQIIKNSAFSVAEVPIEINLAKVLFEIGKATEAIRYCNSAISKCNKGDRLDLLWEPYYLFANYYEKLQNWSKANDYYKLAIRSINDECEKYSFENFRMGFLNSKYEVFTRYVDFLYSAYLADESFFNMNLIYLAINDAKARVFHEALSGYLDYIKEESATKKLRLPDIFSDVAIQLGDLRLSERTPTLVSRRLLSLKEIQKTLKSSTVILEYMLGEKNSWLMAIGKNYVEINKLPSRREIEKSVDGLIVFLRQGGNDLALQNAATRVAREILPRLTCLQAKELIIIPDGILCRIPFETLRVNKDKKNAYLIEGTKISYALSIDSLQFLLEKRRKRAELDLLAFGDPLYERVNLLWAQEIARIKEFPHLRNSETELRSISSFFQPKRVVLKLGESATEEEVKGMRLDNFKILHFACHGTVDDSDPLQSALVLSRGAKHKEDGFLRASEILQLKMNADLVVLSACQSDSGMIQKGEGIIGITRIFFYAGASSVLSTLWKIDDSFTAIFMTEFYRNLKLGKSLMEALQVTKTNMIKTRFSNPFYWGAFILNGNFRLCPFESKK